MRKLTTFGAIAVLGISALAGCGSDDNDTETASNGGGTTAAQTDGPVSADNVAAAKAEVEKHLQIPAFEPGGEPIDVASLKGKTIYSIPITLAIPFYKDGEAAMKQAAEKAGLKYVTYPSQGKVSDFQQGFADAINAKASVIILNGPLPDTLQPQIKQAHAAGIKVIAAHEEDVSQPVPAGVDAVAAAEFYNGARLMVDNAIADRNGEAVNALVITSNDTRPSKGMGEAIQDQLKKRCGDECKATLTNVPVADWAAKVQGEVQSALNRDGEINTILPIFDSMIQYVDPGVRQAGGDRDIKSYSFNGTPSLNSFLTNDRSTFEANVGEDPLWIAYLTMDQAFRVMLDKEPVDQPAAPLRIFNADNAADQGDPPAIGKGYGDEYIPGYEKLWGLQ
ncbi:MAG: substrate-binding domain-containing protein [Patulibacter sp.]|nr:substrate-binding domain-containing protein [Patulibacter sp.]